MSAAGQSRGRLHERGEAEARSARPRVLAAADMETFKWLRDGSEASGPLGGGGAQRRCGGV